MEELARKKKADLQLPRYQRPKGKWDANKQFKLSMSIFFDLPAGYICWKETGTSKMLIDGRQRRMAIRDMLDPLSYSEMVVSAIPKEVNIAGGSKSDELDKRIFESARDWLKSYNKDSFKGLYSDWTLEDLQELCDERGIPWDNSKTQDFLASKLADWDLETGIGLDKKYQDALKPVYELVHVILKDKSTAKAGFNVTYKKLNVGLKKAWGLNSDGPNANVEEPEFFEWKNSKWVFNTNIFSRDLEEFFRASDWDIDDCQDVKKLVKWLRQQYSSILMEGDQAKLIEFFRVTNRETQHKLIAEKFLAVRQRISKTQLGVCSLTETCTITEAMKVFQLINSEGVPLSEIEIMASWPDWGHDYVYDSSNPAPPNVQDTVEEMYVGKKAMEFDVSEISKWDIAATVLPRLKHTAIWGD
jgi:hypothetical protein